MYKFNKKIRQVIVWVMIVLWAAYTICAVVRRIPFEEYTETTVIMTLAISVFELKYEVEKLKSK